MVQGVQPRYTGTMSDSEGLDYHMEGSWDDEQHYEGDKEEDEHTENEVGEDSNAKISDGRLEKHTKTSKGKTKEASKGKGKQTNEGRTKDASEGNDKVKHARKGKVTLDDMYIFMVEQKRAMNEQDEKIKQLTKVLSKRRPSDADPRPSRKAKISSNDMELDTEIFDSDQEKFLSRDEDQDDFLDKISQNAERGGYRASYK